MDHKKNLIVLTIIFTILSLVFWGKTGNILVDFSREIYIPQQMNLENKLIKDIFLIYGPFGYIVNSIICKVSTNVNLLILEAHLISYSILILTYAILNKFFTRKVSFIFTIIFLIVSIFSYSTFSFVLPYSYSTLWGILGIYATLAALLYNKKNIAFFALGLISINKIELFIPAFATTIIYLVYKKENFLKDFLYIFIFPIIPLIYLLFSQIKPDEIIRNFELIKKMVSTNSIKTLYQGMGCFFEISYFKYNLIEIVKLILICTTSYLFWFIKKPTYSYSIAILGLAFINNNFCLNLIAFFAIFLTILSLNKRQIAKEEILLFLFSLILCSKALFAVNALNYSNFGYCLIIYYTFLQLQKYVNTRWLINILLIFFTFSIIDKTTYTFTNLKYPTKTEIGTFWLDEKNVNLFSATNAFIKKHIKQEESFIVVPEGQIFNAIHKKNYKFLNSTFTPLDFETFGEKNIIKQLKSNKTDYIIFYPRNTKDYGAQTICYDYGVDFCHYIIDNYTRVGTLEDNYTTLIFKIKK